MHERRKKRINGGGGDGEEGRSEVTESVATESLVDGGSARGGEES